MATAAQTPSNVKFMSVAQFKAAIGANNLSVLRSPISNKLFASADGAANYKVQQNIDPSQEMKFLIENDDMENACLCNVKPGAETVFSL